MTLKSCPYCKQSSAGSCPFCKDYSTVVDGDQPFYPEPGTEALATWLGYD